MSMAGDEPEHVVVVPGGLLAPSAQAGPARCYAEGEPEGQAQVRRLGRRVHGHADRQLISCVTPAYETRLIGLEERISAAHRQKHPFGMVPVFEADGRRLIESGAIVYAIAKRSAAL